MRDGKRRDVSRREFVKTAAAGAGATLAAGGFPAIVPASVINGQGPSGRINVAAIGTGRIARAHDLPGVWRYDEAQVVAVCDLDGRRAEDEKRLVNDYYGKKTGKPYNGVRVYADYRELLLNRETRASSPPSSGRERFIYMRARSTTATGSNA